MHLLKFDTSGFTIQPHLYTYGSPPHHASTPCNKPHLHPKEVHLLTTPNASFPSPPLTILSTSPQQTFTSLPPCMNEPFRNTTT
ncbi:hypothetical protein Pmani_024169 [Petrolisthes manimaculis]|uniref:Uncharacterized protein n=1 Tax=Petrolisthes manimaculis TaxID=1843537 RepID=A0AAE1P9A5_9EUCA|nr:hypothetical protein Pmani_024169 [Petrolisthes manimaculis]